MGRSILPLMVRVKRKLDNLEPPVIVFASPSSEFPMSAFSDDDVRQAFKDLTGEEISTVLELVQIVENSESLKVILSCAIEMANEEGCVPPGPTPTMAPQPEGQRRPPKGKGIGKNTKVQNTLICTFCNSQSVSQSVTVFDLFIKI